MKSSSYYLKQADRHSRSQRRKWLHRAKKAKRACNSILEIFVWNSLQFVPANVWRIRNEPSAKISVSLNPPASRDAIIAKGGRSIVYHF